jgi:hypothetical protein
MKSLVVVALAVAGCAASPEVRRAEEARRIRCASIEIFPMSIAPPRPYRVLGPVVVDVNSRDDGLRNRACQLDADAIVDYRREVPDITPAVMTANAYYHAENERALLSGVAVVYTDKPSASTTPIAPAPIEATAIGTPPPPPPPAEATATGTPPQQ